MENTFSAPGPACSVFVGNAAWTTTAEMLEQCLAENGAPAASLELKVSSSGQSKGWAIAQFTTAEEAEAAIQNCNGLEVEGRQLNIRLDRGDSRNTRGAATSQAPYQEQEGEVTSGTHVYVGNLAWSITTEDLSQFLAAQGAPAVSVEVQMQRTTGRSKGFAIAEYATDEDALTAIQACNGLEMDSRAIHLRHDNKKGARPRQRAPKNVAPGTEGAGGAPRGGNSDFKIFVGNLSWDTTWETLKEHFATAGDVEHADVMADKKTGRSKGFGIVAMASAYGAESAIALLNETELDGRNISVREYKN